MRSRWPLLLLLLLFAGVAWWAVAGSGDQVPASRAPVDGLDALEARPADGPALTTTPQPAAGGAAPPDAEGAAPAADGFRLRGRVVEVGTGAPASGALVRLRMEGRADFDTVVCDPGGHFHVTRPEARLEVFVLGGGWVTDQLAEVRQSDFDVAGFNPLPVVLAADRIAERVFPVVRVAVVTGRVLDESGQAIPGAEVSAHARRRHYKSFPRYPAALAKAGAGLSDAKGRYRIDTLVPGLEHRVSARTKERGTGSTIKFLAEAGQTHELDVHLPRSRWARVRVVELGTQRGVPGLEVHVSSARSSAIRATTNADGWVRVGPLARGRVHVSTGSGAWRLAERPPVVGEAESEADVEVVLEVQPAHAIAGTLLDMHGKPAVGAWLEAKQGDHEHRTDADEKGHFQFQGLTEGRWKIEVLESFGGAVLLTAAAEAGTTELELRLEQALAFDTEVIVLGPDGKTVPRCDYKVGGTWGSTIATDATTPLLLGPSKEPRWLEVSSPRSADRVDLPYAAASMGPVSPNTRSVTIRMAAGTDIKGSVLGPDGEGVVGVGLSAFPLDRGPATGKLGGFHATVRSGEGGLFTLGGLRKATAYYLFVDAGDHWAPVERLDAQAGDQDVVVRLQQATAVDLRILDPEGKPVEEVIVQVSRLGNRGGLAYGRTDAKGLFRAHGLLADGEYALELRPPEKRPDVRLLEVEPWSPTEREFKLPRADILRGAVVDETGRPLAQAAVYGLDADRREHLATADAEGRFELGQLPAGDVRLVAESQGDPFRRSRPMEATSKQQPLRLVARTMGELVVVLENWAPAENEVHMSLRPRGRHLGSWPYGRPDSTGRGTIEKVDPEERYGLHVRVRTKDALLVGWAADVRGDAGELRLPLKPAQSIRGKLVAPTGMRPAFVRIRERGIDLRVNVDAEGRFVLEGLPEGTFELTGVSRGKGRRHEVKGPAASGADVELR